MVLGISLVSGAITLVVANVLLQEEITWYSWLLQRRALIFLGRISYSVYLWQQVFLTSQNPTFLAKWPINLVAALAMGWLSYRCIELPFIGLKDKYFHSPAKAPAPPQTAIISVPET